MTARLTTETVTANYYNARRLDKTAAAGAPDFRAAQLIDKLRPRLDLKFIHRTRWPAESLLPSRVRAQDGAGI
jgi:hypothetical protein